MPAPSTRAARCRWQIQDVLYLTDLLINAERLGAEAEPSRGEAEKFPGPSSGRRAYSARIFEERFRVLAAAAIPAPLWWRVAAQRRRRRRRGAAPSL